MLDQRTWPNPTVRYGIVPPDDQDQIRDDDAYGDCRTGCGRNGWMWRPDPDAAAKASATCVSALRSQLPDTEQSDLDNLHTQVNQSEKAWTVEGQLPSTGRQFRCRVEPDPTDHLRGMRAETTWLGPDPTQ